MTIFGNNFWWQFSMTIFIYNLWWKFMTILIIFDNWDNFWQFWKDSPGDLWHLRHWLQFRQLRTWIHDNLWYLTINCDTGQHSQFLRCFFYMCVSLASITCVFVLQVGRWKTRPVECRAKTELCIFPHPLGDHTHPAFISWKIYICMTNNYYILTNMNLHAKLLFNLDQCISHTK